MSFLKCHQLLLDTGSLTDGESPSRLARESQAFACLCLPRAAMMSRCTHPHLAFSSSVLTVGLVEPLYITFYNLVCESVLSCCEGSPQPQQLLLKGSI